MDHTKQPAPDTPEDGADEPPLQRVSNLSCMPPLTEEEDSDETDDATIQYLVEDVRTCYANKIPLCETYFYKVVLGGNVDVVKRTVQYLEAHCDVRIVAWLFNTGCEQRRKRYKPIKQKIRLAVTRWVVFFFSALFGILTSPVFYCIHGLFYALIEQRKRYLSNRIKLPLAFAAYSHSIEMVKYFFQKNIRAVFTDDRYNNVFHYIADLAAESSGNACTAFDVMMEALEGEPEDYIREVLFEKQNSQGLTVLEYTARYGSPALLTKVMNYQNLIRRTPFCVRPKCVNLKPDPEISKEMTQEPSTMEVKVDATQNVHVALLQNEKERNEEKPSKESLEKSSRTSMNCCWGEATTRVDFVDVTKYESHHLTKRSLLLRLIGTRSIGEITIQDLRLFQKCPVVGKWINMKVNEMKRYIFAFHTLDVIVTILLFVLLAFLRGSVPYQLQSSLNFFRSHLGEVVSRMDNRSEIISNEALSNVLQRTIQDKQFDWSVGVLDDKDLEYIIQGSDNNPVIVSRSNGNKTQKGKGLGTLNGNGLGLLKNKTYGHSLPPNIKDEVIDKAFEDMPESQEKLTYQNLFILTVIFSRQFIADHPDIHLIQLTEKNVEMLQQELDDYFYDFETEIQGKILKPCEYFGKDEWRSLFCPSMDNLTLHDFHTKVTIPPPEHQATDICRWQSLVAMGEENCKPDTPVQVYARLKYLLQLNIDNKRMSDVVVWIMLVFALLYIAIDIYERVRFFYLAIQENFSTMGMIRSVLTWRIPGSYYRKQLNVITYCVLILNVCAQTDFVAMYYSNTYVSKVTNQMLLIGLCLRFIMHIHSLRLFPWIGHFVITTFRMATNLIHFSTVLGVVIFIFSVIFHILITDDSCPIRKSEGFTNIGMSMFSVFQLTFGHGEFAAYMSSPPVMFTYALFTIICSLLLLNLIIAIMSTTAMDLMTPDGKEALGKLEWLNESLAAEYTVTALVGSCYKDLLYRDHRKAGYVVTTGTKTPKVYIRVFYCPKLD